jgi:integrase/recombinase XerD
MDLSEFKNYLISKFGQSKTVENYYFRLTHFFKSYNEFNQENARVYLTNLCGQGKISANNLSIHAFNHYKLFLGVTFDAGTTQKTSSPQKVGLSIDEIEKEILPYFSQLFSNDVEKRVYIFRFMVWTMLRISEIVNLKKKDIDFKNEIINVHGKGHQYRQVPFLNKQVGIGLKKYCEISKSDYVFYTTEASIKYIFDIINSELRYRKKAETVSEVPADEEAKKEEKNIEYIGTKITPHLLRHTGAKIYFKQTGDIMALKNILGHSSISTTQKYIAYGIEDVKEASKGYKYKMGETK